MPKARVEEWVDDRIPADVPVRARLEAVSAKTIQWVDKNTGEDREADLWSWEWKVIEGEWEGTRVSGDTDARISMHEANKARRWFEALIGSELQPEMELDTDDLIGLAADITVRHRQGKRGDRVFVEVDDVAAITERVAAQPPF